MTAQDGSRFYLKVGDGGSPETFSTVGGLRLTNFVHHNQVRDTTNVTSGGWRTLSDGGGISAVSISGSGTFTDSAAETTVRGSAMASQIKNYQICFGNGDVLSGAFQITAYKRSGSYGIPETFSIALASSGQVVYTPA